MLFYEVWLFSHTCQRTTLSGSPPASDLHIVSSKQARRGRVRQETRSNECFRYSFLFLQILFAYYSIFALIKQKLCNLAGVSGSAHRRVFSSNLVPMETTTLASVDQMCTKACYYALYKTALVVKQRPS